jgi:hypothetical protein
MHVHVAERHAVERLEFGGYTGFSPDECSVQPSRA